MGRGHQGDWLHVSVSAAGVASLRVYVWRQLHKLGAVYLQSSVCLLPDRPPVARSVARISARVRAQGGQARVLRVRLTDRADLDQVITEQRSGRDTEYAELVERVPEFLTEIERETAGGRATYAEVEESEADLERFERWLASIADRDYFDAAGGGPARAAVERCRAALAEFERLALTADTKNAAGLDAEDADTHASTLRLVRDDEPGR